jgi:hypothetical protein
VHEYDTLPVGASASRPATVAPGPAELASESALLSRTRRFVAGTDKLDSRYSHLRRPNVADVDDDAHAASTPADHPIQYVSPSESDGLTLTRSLSESIASACIFFGEAVLMMELPRRHSTPLEGGRFAPIKSSNYGGRPLTGPLPDDLSELRLVEWSGWVNE